MVRVLLFASVRDLLGAGEIELPSAPSGEIRTAGDVFDALCRRRPELESYRKRIRVAVNETYGNLESPVTEGDVVALFPPVSGGTR